ncbi:MAG: helix-turn-helix domain-containing protein [Clostridia bacterium]|nr:helix-turn-helix domain-containing protein [Clostridia bacterium]
MENQVLARHKHYFYYHWEFFQTPHDLVHAFLEKDFNTGMHEQEFYEINIITKGSGVHYIHTSRVEATIGDVFIIPPRVSHGYLGGEGFDVFHLLLSDTFMNKHMADMQLFPSFYTLFGAEPMMRGKTESNLYLKLSPEDFKVIMNILWQIAHYKNYGDTVEDLMRSNFAMIAIGMMCQTYTQSCIQRGFDAGNDHAIMKSISFIHEKYFEKITIDDLTHIAHISRTSYIKKFKEICKMSPAAYITKIRIESASVMLLNTSLTISEIAYKTGFYDVSHLTKAFASVYHMSPIAYRDKNK